MWDKKAIQQKEVFMSNHQDIHVYIKFMFFKKATKIDKIFKSQIDGEDFVNFCGLLRKHVLGL